MLNPNLPAGVEDIQASRNGRARIAVIEHQALFRRSLVHLLERDDRFSVIPGCIDTCDVRQIASQKPHIVLFDVDFHEGDPLDSIQILRAEAPRTKICLLSMQGHADLLSRGLLLGVEGYLIKEIAPADLTRALLAIHSGDPYVDPRLAGRMLRRASEQRFHANPNDLSERELEIVRLIAVGLSNKEISDKLCLSEKTVKNHISHIFSKMNVTARTQAAIRAIKTGIV